MEAVIFADQDCCEGCCSVPRPPEPILSSLRGLCGFGLRGRTCLEQRMCSEVLVLGGARVSAGTKVWVAVIRRCPGPGRVVARQCCSGNIWHQRG